MAWLTRLVRFESFDDVDFGECSKVCGVGEVGDFDEVGEFGEVSEVGVLGAFNEEG